MQNAPQMIDSLKHSYVLLCLNLSIDRLWSMWNQIW